jgi:hypothetical protein
MKATKILLLLFLLVSINFSDSHPAGAVLRVMKLLSNKLLVDIFGPIANSKTVYDAVVPSDFGKQAEKVQNEINDLVVLIVDVKEMLKVLPDMSKKLIELKKQIELGFSVRNYEEKYLQVTKVFFEVKKSQKRLISVVKIKTRQNLLEDVKILSQNYINMSPDYEIVQYLTTVPEASHLSKSLVDCFVDMVVANQYEIRSTLNQMIYWFYYTFSARIVEINEYHLGLLRLLKEKDAENAREYRQSQGLFFTRDFGHKRKKAIV